ncbi:NAD(P)/FAD-dependent oxidoreductase [Ottowia thiooxydans]|uniref:NAD(P)/FAD-dependent oxidoreductase n=1 Tax=Ottowia thiooxydans TaxID=219182 RepID=UPI0003F8C2EF|nr:FAD-dependent oxidoreductase [Ottowia thiooxydans]
MRVVIVGAGQAGAWVVQRLRANDPDCVITLVGEEPWAPYERPPLSKASFVTDDSAPRFILSVEQAAKLNVSLLLGTTVVQIDRARKCAVTRGHGELAYDKLVLATGGSARRLQVPGHDLPGVCYLRTWEDATQLRGRLNRARTLLVVGGGWIGLEVAASARMLGCNVVLVESSERLCARTVPPWVSGYLARQHELRGVTVKLSCEVSKIELSTEGGLVAHTSDGALDADLIAVGVGLQPNIGLAAACGLEVANGILVDAFGGTSDPDIYACGDVANQPLATSGERIRIESYANAINHAVTVADHLSGRPQDGKDVPWFWSDQFDFQLQVLGYPSGDGEWVTRGDEGQGKFCLFQIQGGVLQSVISVNMARELKLAKRWMKAGVCPPAHVLRDLTVRLDKV